MGKKRIPRENVLLYQYVKNNYPNAMQWFRVRVGPIPKGKYPHLYAGARRWCDCVIYDGKQVYLIEAKIKADPGAIGQLINYINLFKKTPEFSMLKDKKVTGIFLTAVDDANVRELAKQLNIKYVLYQPEWIKDYLSGGEGNPWK